MKPINRSLILTLVILMMGLSACGFQLRGANLQALQNARIFVQSLNASLLTSEVNQQLNDADVKPVPSATNAEYIVTLSNEKFDRKVLSVSPETGKVEEYEVTFTAMMKITSADETPIVRTETVSATRDYTFDEGSVLGKIEEESVLRKDIVSQAAASVIRQLRAAVQ